MSEETSSQKQQQQQQPPPQPQHVTSWPGKQVETLRLWEEAVKARKKGKMRWPVLTVLLEQWARCAPGVLREAATAMGNLASWKPGNTMLATKLPSFQISLFTLTNKNP